MRRPGRPAATSARGVVGAGAVRHGAAGGGYTGVEVTTEVGVGTPAVAWGRPAGLSYVPPPDPGAPDGDGDTVTLRFRLEVGRVRLAPATAVEGRAVRGGGTDAAEAIGDRFVRQPSGGRRGWAGQAVDWERAPLAGGDGRVSGVAWSTLTWHLHDPHAPTPPLSAGAGRGRPGDHRLGEPSCYGWVPFAPSTLWAGIWANPGPDPGGRVLCGALSGSPAPLRARRSAGLGLVQ